MSLLAGCWGDDDNDNDPGSGSGGGAAGAPLTAAQIGSAQAALDEQSAPVDSTSSGSPDTAVSQAALDQAAGLTTEAGR